ncbi:alpha-L-rhamnosidase-related protein [Galbibacter mesophilus]|uniref:alpha-L-rhamnosidase-related protein n=1 Tax=Galbibacter mesophilus TaxID=379069 RepID=UPI00191FEC24|nr:glycogen debranching protein [Galbibacter mesophilus]MCM5664304.1 glycogen debranching protein [Galbibacter mesophilus]
MFRKYVFFILFMFFLQTEAQKAPFNMVSLLKDTEHIEGKDAYLNSPFVTPGNRLYMVGHQNGTFPELGWHIKGEMGGIWSHPIKLMDGFKVVMKVGDDSFDLNKANRFVNYPFANLHEFTLKEKNLSVKRFQFVPDDTEGVIIQFVIRNTSKRKSDFTFAFTGYSDLRPTWLSEKLSIEDGKDIGYFNASENRWEVKDEKNPWFLVVGSSLDPVNSSEEKINYQGKGVANTFSYKLSLNGKEQTTLTFFIAGSSSSKESAVQTLNRLKANSSQLFKEKKERYQELATFSQMEIPDEDLQKAFRWLKYNADWLVTTVPGIGTGIAAGIPDYPWWFGVDSEYALQGYMAVGQHETAYKTIKLLDSISEATNGNGRIVHEVSTNGVVFNKGNINETPQFASLIWEVYQWNGDERFLKEYYPTIKKGLHWLMKENDADGNLFPDGFGMMEIHGLDSEMIDVASYSQRGFNDAASIAAVLNDDKSATYFDSIANQLKEKINEEFWSDEFNSFADFIGTDEEALHLIEDALIRADTLNKPWAVNELKNTRNKILQNPSDANRPFVLYHNWVVNTPMAMKIADSIKAIEALNTAEKYVNPFGVFVTGIDRDESAGKDDGSFKGSKVFSYTGAVMTLPTGVQAIAENNYGRPDKALDYLKRMTRTFSYALPGSMYEVSPDYGMMTQAWNIYSYAIPLVKQFFGIQPNAAKKEVIIQPQMPESWDNAAIKNVKVANNSIDVEFKKDKERLSVKVKQQNPDWTIRIICPIEWNGEKFKPFKPKRIESSKGRYIAMGNGNQLEVVLTYQ